MMFNQNKRSEPIDMDKIDTFIGKSTTFEGTIQAEGTVRIDGNTTGEIVVSGNIIIGENATIKGNIKADSAHIAGSVQGNISVKSQLHLTPTAKLNGDIVVKHIIIDEGAIFIGNSKIASEAVK